MKEAASSPILALTRGAPVVKGGKTMVPVTFLDPRPQNDAVTSVGFAPPNGFFSSHRYRGAFAPDLNWLCGWTAAQAFGFTASGSECNYCDLGLGMVGTNGQPLLSVTGDLTPNSPVQINLRSALASAPVAFIVGESRIDVPLLGGTLVPNVRVRINVFTDPSGNRTLPAIWPAGFPSGFSVYLQAWVFDPAGPLGLVASNGVQATQP